MDNEWVWVRNLTSDVTILSSSPDFLNKGVQCNSRGILRVDMEVKASVRVAPTQRFKSLRHVVRWREFAGAESPTKSIS